MPDEISLSELFTGVASPEPVEAVFGEELFVSRMDSVENLLVVQIVGIGLVVGLLFATLIMRFFNVR